MTQNGNKRIAYFSMEIAVHPRMPTYSGGLGMLAGDTLRSAADRRLPMVAVSLLHRQGYFCQKLDPSGWQSEVPETWNVAAFVRELPARVTIHLEGRPVQVRAWQFDVPGRGGHVVPVYFLDTDLDENTDQDRHITDCLYGGDDRYRLLQEAVLGIAGVKLLWALGHSGIERYHMNEGHAALLTLELIRGAARDDGRAPCASTDLARIRDQCVFTTHTPVPAGHDRFPLELVQRVLSGESLAALAADISTDGELNMTHLALAASRYVNGVALSHGEVSREMFPQYDIDAITNGVHAATWTSAPFRRLFDEYIPTWADEIHDSFSLRHALSIPTDRIWQAHAEAKRRLLDRVNAETQAGMDPGTLTIGFARRATAYKRAGLLFQDLERLRAIATRAGKFQVVFAGKAHPKDKEGKAIIQSILQARDTLRDQVRIAYLANYDWELGGLMTAGADVWLNTPHPPQEASGTSGMKAAINGVPSLSVLDGWWGEGCIEGKTGWAVDPGPIHNGDRTTQDAAALYGKLENTVLPLYYRNQPGFAEVMKQSIALNGSFFNTQRMVLQYVLRAYWP